MLNYRTLPRSFYEPSAKCVARKLLGHWLLRNLPAGVCGGTIVETEAYLTNDPACHAFPGQTPRNRVMFDQPGHAYVYFIYGCHFCVNAVCRPPGTGEAVLIRAIEPAFGEPLLREHRVGVHDANLSNGPGKLCQAMNIDRRMNGVDLCDPNSELFIAENPKVADFIKERAPVIVSPRIGITQATTEPLRFFLSGSSFVSRRWNGNLQARPGKAGKAS